MTLGGKPPKWKKIEKTVNETRRKIVSRPSTSKGSRELRGGVKGKGTDKKTKQGKKSIYCPPAKFKTWKKKRHGGKKKVFFLAENDGDEDDRDEEKKKWKKKRERSQHAVLRISTPLNNTRKPIQPIPDPSGHPAKLLAPLKTRYNFRHGLVVGCH